MLRLRSVLLVLLSLLYVASWPGAAVRSAVLPLVAAPVPADTANRDGSLDVVVHATDGDKGPIVGATVRAFAILDGLAHDAGQAVTDKEGRAALDRLPNTEHWIVAEAPGRARASRMVVIVSGARRLDLELAPEHTLNVEVRTEAGEPVIGAELEVRGSDPFPVGARTGADGRVSVGRLGEGPFTVLARAPGFEETTRRRVLEKETCIVTLGKHGAFLVSVRDATGNPAPGARVFVTSPALWPARVAETSADGSVRIGALASGSYSLRAVRNSDVSPIEVGLGVEKGEEKGVELRLAPGVMIAVHVIDATTDDDVRGAATTLVEGGLSPFPIEGTTDKHGKVGLGPIARGSGSTLAVHADGFVAKPAIQVADPPPKETTVALVRGGTLVGKVVDARGYVVDGATIRVVGTDLEGMPIDEDPEHASFRDAHFAAVLKGPTPLVSAGELGVMPGPVPSIPHEPLGINTDALEPKTKPRTEPWVTGRDGTFEAKPIPPGRVRAIVRHPQYVEAMSEVVTIASEKSSRVEIVLSRGGTLEGTVFDVKHRPVANARVSALASRGSMERVARTGTDGSFAFASLPQAVTLLVSRDADTSRIASRTEVAIPEAGKKTVEIVLPAERDPLDVMVTDGRNGIDTVQLTAVSLDPNEALRVTAFTNARGEATLVSTKGLPLRVEARAPGRAPKVVVTTPTFERLTIELAAAESLSGEVRARRDTIEGAELVLTSENGIHRARSNKEGAFTFPGLAPGPAHLRVRAKGYAPLVRDVAIEERGGRRATDLGRLELAEEGVVEGIVVDDRGNPIPGARVAKDAVPTYLPANTNAPPVGMAVCDPKGHFRLEELAPGNVTLEAYAADYGRARTNNVRIMSGRTTEGLKIVLGKGDSNAREPLATGGVAITLGETSPAEGEVVEVVVVAVIEGSEAERAGLIVYDVITEIGGAPVTSITDARARLSGPVQDDVLVKVRRASGSVSLRVRREAVRR